MTVDLPEMGAHECSCPTMSQLLLRVSDAGQLVMVWRHSRDRRVPPADVDFGESKAGQSQLRRPLATGEHFLLQSWAGHIYREDAEHSGLLPYVDVPLVATIEMLDVLMSWVDIVMVYLTSGSDSSSPWGLELHFLPDSLRCGGF